jgi:hypothetical protein
MRVPWLTCPKLPEASGPCILSLKLVELLYLSSNVITDEDYNSRIEDQLNISGDNDFANLH